MEFPGKNTGVGCHALLQGIFLTQGLTCISRISCIGRWILCHLRRPWLKHMAESCREKGWERSMASFASLSTSDCVQTPLTLCFHLSVLFLSCLFFFRPVCWWGDQRREGGTPPQSRVKRAIRLHVVWGEGHCSRCSFHLSDGDTWLHHTGVYIFPLTRLLLQCLTHFCLCLKTSPTQSRCPSSVFPRHCT